MNVFLFLGGCFALSCTYKLGTIPYGGKTSDDDACLILFTLIAAVCLFYAAYLNRTPSNTQYHQCVFCGDDSSYALSYDECNGVAEEISDEK